MYRSILENTIAAGTSLLTIVAPKFCCWSSALAAMSGGTSYLAWVYPMRPYLFGLSFVLIGYSLLKAYRQNKDGCEACQKTRNPFLHSKRFAWLAAIFVVTMFLIALLE